VRQTAHSVQGSIACVVGKRIAPYLPQVIGAWLAGFYDNDRPVHRAALESFMQVFTTEEKRNGVWKVYQGSILDFVDDVILQQTPQTLSDERTVKPDDAEAKYARVVGTALLLLNRVIGVCECSRGRSLVSDFISKFDSRRSPKGSGRGGESPE
jgi:hypothetical protein